jgi:hypothetical protein
LMNQEKIFDLEEVQQRAERMMAVSFGRIRQGSGRS